MAQRERLQKGQAQSRNRDEQPKTKLDKTGAAGRALTTPELAQPADYAALQQTAGNRATLSAIQSNIPLQAKAVVMPANDPLEAAADRTARQAVRGSASGASTSAPDADIVQAKSDGNQTGMPDGLKADMEHALGADFSDVRVHDNSGNAPALGALAYTQGTDIHMAPGQYRPESPAGRELLAHELAHVVQQREGKVKPTIQRKVSEEDLRKRKSQTGRVARLTQQFEKGQSSQPKSSSAPQEVSQDRVAKLRQRYEGGSSSEPKTTSAPKPTSQERVSKLRQRFEGGGTGSQPTGSSSKEPVSQERVSKLRQRFEGGGSSQSTGSKAPANKPQWHSSTAMDESETERRRKVVERRTEYDRQRREGLKSQSGGRVAKLRERFEGGSGGSNTGPSKGTQDAQSVIPKGTVQDRIKQFEGGGQQKPPVPSRGARDAQSVIPKGRVQDRIKQFEGGGQQKPSGPSKGAQEAQTVIPKGTVQDRIKQLQGGGQQKPPVPSRGARDAQSVIPKGTVQDRIKQFESGGQQKPSGPSKGAQEAQNVIPKGTVQDRIKQLQGGGQQEPSGPSKGAQEAQRRNPQGDSARSHQAASGWRSARA